MRTFAFQTQIAPSSRAAHTRLSTRMSVFTWSPP
jgi:hypothetical protein